MDEVQFGDAVGTRQIYRVTVHYKWNQNEYVYIYIDLSQKRP